MTNAFDWRNWECPVNGRIKWGVQNLDKQRAQSVAQRLEEARLENRGYGTVTGLSKKDSNLLPKLFHVYSRAKPMIEKHKYIRSKELLKKVSELECQHCGSPYMIQAAHTNWGHGKGRGIKADDNMVAALCLKCHYEVDQGKNLSREERQEMWFKAHKRTVETLIERGVWPKGVPKPNNDMI